MGNPTLREQKTKKVRRMVVKKKVVGAIQRWLAVHPQRGDDDAPLFNSYRLCQALTVSSVSRLEKAKFKRWDHDRSKYTEVFHS